MTAMRVRECAGCGAPLPEDTNVCEFCGNENIDDSVKKKETIIDLSPARDTTFAPTVPPEKSKISAIKIILGCFGIIGVFLLLFIFFFTFAAFIDRCSY